MMARKKFVGNENVDPAARAKTNRRIAIANLAVTAILAVPILSGKSMDQFNSPGFKDSFDKREAEKKAWIESENARMAALKARPRSGGPPPKPWERQ